jgi:SWI/SNF-related matrix-associated actin-dependent regulator 1 of chromatin subfamily A
LAAAGLAGAALAAAGLEGAALAAAGLEAAALAAAGLGAAGLAAAGLEAVDLAAAGLEAVDLAGGQAAAGSCCCFVERARGGDTSKHADQADSSAQVCLESGGFEGGGESPSRVW